MPGIHSWRESRYDHYSSVRSSRSPTRPSQRGQPSLSPECWRASLRRCSRAQLAPAISTSQTSPATHLRMCRWRLGQGLASAPPATRCLRIHSADSRRAEWRVSCLAACHAGQHTPAWTNRVHSSNQVYCRAATEYNSNRVQQQSLYCTSRRAVARATRDWIIPQDLQRT